MSVVVPDPNAARVAGAQLPRRPGWLLSLPLDCALSIAAYLVSYRLRFQGAQLDLFLPGALSGADLVRELRTRRVDLPVIGFSVGGTAARRAFLEAGADLFLDKPIALRDVFATLERLSVAAARREV